MMEEFPLFSSVQKNSSNTAPQALTVSELTQKLRGVVEPLFALVWIKGEISNYKPAPSGHVYFSLKDQNATISVALFGWGSKKKNFELKEGLEVLCRGKISIYPPRGNYQFIVDQIDPLGVGALQLAFEQLKEKLFKEGLFKNEIKRPLPRFPQRIVIITSPTGAVIQDMLNILKRRAPHIQITLVPTLVQGLEAPARIMEALEIANKNDWGDLIVLARGGGSIEDLWAFNHEDLARTIRNSRLPVISAVGHEVDFTISDFVSDLRAPTPSAAAEILSTDWVQVVHYLEDLASRMQHEMLRSVQDRKNILIHLSARVVNPKDKLREQSQKVDEMFARFDRAMSYVFEKKKFLFHQIILHLDALSPLKVLERGYALIQDPLHPGTVIKSVKQIKPSQELRIQFYDGQTQVRTE